MKSDKFFIVIYNSTADTETIIGTTAEVNETLIRLGYLSKLFEGAGVRGDQLRAYRFREITSMPSCNEIDHDFFMALNI